MLDVILKTIGTVFVLLIAVKIVGAIADVFHDDDTWKNPYDEIDE